MKGAPLRPTNVVKHSVVNYGVGRHVPTVVYTFRHAAVANMPCAAPQPTARCVGVKNSKIAGELPLHEAALTWKRRGRNQNADNLTNGKFVICSPDLRVATELAEIRWEVLSTLHDEAMELHRLAQEKKASNTKVSHPKQRCKKGGAGLKFTDPWYSDSR